MIIDELLQHMCFMVIKNISTSSVGIVSKGERHWLWNCSH
jgi:hypothetical protein